MTWIKEIVEGLIEVYETKDVYELLELLGITLIKKDLGEGIKGRFFRDIFGNEFIFISNDLCPQEEKQVIAHELAHAILHVTLTTSYYTENQLIVKNKLEIEANTFASELLLSDYIDFLSYEGMTIEQISSSLEVSEELFRLKFRKEL